MKIITTLSILLLICNVGISQESIKKKRSSKIGITYSSFGENDVIRFQELEGAASYDNDHFFTLGLTYLHPLNNWLSLETGIEYSKHTIITTPNLPPSMDNSPYKSNFSVINIPLSVRAEFLKYFFLNGGCFIGMDTSTKSVVDSQSGLGTIIGIGVNYDFKFGASIFLNSYYKTHALLQFSGENYPQRLLESGVRIGVCYKLNKK